MKPMPRPRTPLLDGVYGPHDMRALEPGQLPGLAAEIREFMAAGPGDPAARSDAAVELGIALHRVFNWPRDPFVWGDSSLTRPHELLTGRRELTGPDSDRPQDPPCARVLSYAAGLATAYRLSGCTDRHVVAVVNGSTLTAGGAWEALGSLARTPELRIVVVVVDDEGSLGRAAPGGAARRLGSHGYGRLVGLGKDVLRHTPVVGGPLAGALHSAGQGMRELLTPQGLLADLELNLAESGPVDGHDAAAVEAALRAAKRAARPVIVRCVTQGRERAAEDEQSYVPGRAVQADGPGPQSWTSVFAEEMVKAGAERPYVIGVRACDRLPAPLGLFGEVYPDRVFDFGNAEAHAASCASGMAAGGLHPVVAAHDGFLGHALEQVARDAARREYGVTFALAGSGAPDEIGGADPAALSRMVPGLRCAAPRDGARLRAQLHAALGVEDAPTVLRFPEGLVGPDIEAVAHDRGIDVLYGGPATRGDVREVRDVLIVSVGAMAPVCLEAALLLSTQGVSVTVVDPGWIVPLPARLAELAAEHVLSATVEDDDRLCGVAALLTRALEGSMVGTPPMRFARPVGTAGGAPLTGGIIADTITHRLGEQRACV